MLDKWYRVMSVALLAAATLVRAGSPLTPAEPTKQESPRSAAEQYQSLVKEFTDAQREFMKAYPQAKTAEERQKLEKEKNPRPEDFAVRFLKLAEAYPNDPAALDALIWICSYLFSGPEQNKAVDILLKDYLQSDRLA